MECTVIDPLAEVSVEVLPANRVGRPDQDFNYVILPPDGDTGHRLFRYRHHFPYGDQFVEVGQDFQLVIDKPDELGTDTKGASIALAAIVAQSLNEANERLAADGVRFVLPILADILAIRIKEGLDLNRSR